MKFFWKIYFSMMVMIMICFSVGGYLLIQQGFQTSLNREIQNSYNNNDVMASILNEIYGYHTYQIVDNENRIISSDNIYQSIENNTNILFCLKDEKGHIVYRDGSFKNNDQLIKKLDNQKQGYYITENKNHFFIHTIKPYHKNMYLETKSDITTLFENRHHQFQLLLYYSIILLIISAIVIYILTKWLVQPILQLSLATKKMDFQPIAVKGNDEISQLTNDFNQMSEKLLHTINELHETIERQNMFVGNFAHELKTPLTSIIGYADVLRSKKQEEENVIMYANSIVQEGQRLERLSMKLLQLIVLKKNDFVFQKVSAKYFLKSIEEQISFTFQKNYIQLITQYDDGDIYIEPDLMKTVLMNLLDNARKAVSKNCMIQLLGKKIEKNYIIQVIDYGCGIKEEDISKIMEPFYMADKSRSRSQGGSGLGLAIVNEIVKLHHGEIQIESVPYHHTIVTLTLKGERYDEV